MRFVHFQSGFGNSEDVELSFSSPNAADWVVSFVATVPHHCESQRIVGDLFSCSLEAIDSESEPVPCGSEKELAIINALQLWADASLTTERQERLLTGKFPQMTSEAAMQRSVLWFIGALRERRLSHALSSDGPN